MFTAREVAEKIGWEHSKVTEMCRIGLIKATKIKGRWWVPQEEVERLINIGSLDSKIMDVKMCIERSRMVRVAKGKATPTEAFWFGIGFGRGRFAMTRLLILYIQLAWLELIKWIGEVRGRNHCKVK